MANYNRYFDQQSSKDYYEYNLWENSHFNNGFHFQTQKKEASEPAQEPESSGDELSGGESEKRSEKKDGVQRRVISRDEMLENPDTYCQMYLCSDDEDITESQSQHLSGYDWFKTQWEKGPTHHPNAEPSETEPVPPDTGQTTPASSPSKDKCAGYRDRRNSLQKRIMKAVSQPITISKATSMMERMGWKGGPLGKNSDGIAVPIAPDATYITKKGFGLEETPEPKKREPPPKKKPKMSGVRDVNKKGKPTKKTNKEMAKEKTDQLTTNSLIEILQFVRDSREIEVSFDCKLKPMERKVIHNTVQFITTNTQEVETIDFDNQYHMKLLQLIYESNCFNLVSESDGERNQRQLTLYKEAKEDTYLVTPDDLLPPIEEEDFTDDVIEVNESATSKQTNTATNKAVSANKNKEPDKKLQSHDKSSQSKFKSLQSKSKSSQNESKSSQNESKSIQNECNTSSEDSNPFLKSIERISAKSDIVDIETATNCIETDSTEEVVKDINMSKTVENEINISETLNEYFTEFLKENIYSEFRFLGPFTDKQIEEINLFINNVYNIVYKGECSQGYNDILAKINGEEHNYFEVKEDSNGSIVIYKCKTEETLEEG